VAQSTGGGGDNATDKRNHEGRPASGPNQGWDGDQQRKKRAAECGVLVSAVINFACGIDGLILLNVAFA